MIESCRIRWVASVFLLLVLQSAVIAGMVELTDTLGRTIQAELLQKSGDSITLRKSDGRVYEIGISRLSQESQRAIDEWEKERARRGPLLTAKNRLNVFVAFNKRDKLDKMENFDDRIIYFSPRVKIVNDDIRSGYKSVKCTLVIVGKSVLDGDIRRVLSKQEFRIDLPRKGEAVWKGDNFRVKYDEIENGEAFGYKLDGYIMLIQNARNDIVYSYASSPSWLKPEAKAIELVEGKDYDWSLSRFAF